MPTLDRVGDRLRRAETRGERLLVVYLTLGDPVTGSPADPLELAEAVVAAGADVLEFGIPTAGTRPRGADIAASFDRARSCAPERAWELVGELRTRLPQVPLLALVYPSTVTDLGADRLLEWSDKSELDGLVLTDPAGRLTADRVAAAGLSAVPLLTAATGPARRRELEDAARHFTYQALAERTGVRLDPVEAGRFAEAAAREATKPFLGGFGLRDEHDIRAVAPHVAGVVVGSELYRGLARTAPAARVAAAGDTVRRWKAATILSGSARSRSAHAR
ncbi:tryptophan synthase subunit alpha [Amycolatopsis sp. cmx-8-4]|uniref:tryptophan synthase subunit alpha n=1 Tax=Amycolatopsis sp. cmx-8-4 TaxID=2790947 RepID=UPI00397A629A